MPLPLPMDALRAVNVYITETDQGLVLIDGGWAIPQAQELFVSGLRKLGYTSRDITRFLVTHVHRDHYTQAYVVGQETGAEVSLGIGEKASLDIMHSDELAEDPNIDRLVRAGAVEVAEAWRAMFHGQVRPSMDDYGYPTTWLDQDFSIDFGSRQVLAVSTPGHTQGHYVFADQEANLLFAGDHVLPTITPSIGFEPAWVEQPLRDFLESLAKVRALPDLKLLPAHGPVADSSHARVDELLAHHEHRLQQCIEAVDQGASTAWEVAALIPWTKRDRTRDELGPFDQVMAAFETLAHLDLLALQGRISLQQDGQTRLYQSSHLTDK
ncbi:MAG TPA: MBL fold metallo-hydrolase [Marmoricola sp.]|nr:MBL fold metallo-hydrolase [Marmoricola sp.]